MTRSNLPGYSRKLFTVACYLPPNYNVQSGREALEHIEDVVQELKRSYKDPFLVVGGDFNQWDIQGALQDFPDLRETPVGPTRKDKSIDRLFTNFDRSIEECGTAPPLEPEPGAQGTKSDHQVAFLKASLPKLKTFEWISYQYRFYNEDAVREFGSWLAGHDWKDVVATEMSNGKANLYQETVTAAMERIFPLITVRKKSTNCPWINANIRKLVADRKAIYVREGRSRKWRRLKRLATHCYVRRFLSKSEHRVSE